MSLSLIFWSAIAIAFVNFWWQSDKVKSLALAQVYRYCKSKNLQLLDQTMVLKGVWPVRDELGMLKLRRRYTFEFSSTGEVRYTGTLELFGRVVQKMELEAHVLPPDDDSFI